MFITKQFFTFFFLLFTLSSFAQYTLNGRVTNEEGQPLIGANVILKNTFSGSQTDELGNFKIKNVASGNYEIVVSYLGFSTITQSILVDKSSLDLIFKLEKNALIADEITVFATRANDKTPTAHTNIAKKDLQNANLGQDVPYLLEFTPSTVVTSDAGNGIGYTGIRVRGSDPTRVNITINGVPLNDAESQGVYWVNLPDLASSTESIQIQRGVGTSTNGAGAFGASINLLTNQLNKDAYLELNNSVGSFNTLKNTVKVGTGLLKDKFSVDARLSRIVSDGYIDRAASDLTSFYVTAAYYGNKESLRLNAFGGHERTYQAWYGISADDLLNNRTFNPAGTEKPDEPYENQVDDYQQTHYQLVYNKEFNNQLSLTATAHYTKGKGFYEEYKAQQTASDYGLDTASIITDLVRRRWLDNDFYGAVYALNYESADKKTAVTFGGAANQYLGGHFGEVIETVDVATQNLPFRYYDNDATKNDFNTFIRANHQLSKALNGFVDLQYRRVAYTFIGLDENGVELEQSPALGFFNPKMGLTYTLSKQANLYAYAGIGNKEPNRDDYLDSRAGSQPKHETLYNLELGYRLRQQKAGLEANLYYMDYRNQLALTGELNIDGQYVRTNIDKSYRAGIELSGYAYFSDWLNWSGNATFSQNKIAEFVEYLDSYDADFNWIGQAVLTHENTDLAFSPNVIAQSEWTFNPFAKAAFRKNNRLTVSWLSKYVGKQFIDNTSDESLAAYWVNDSRVRYTLKLNNRKLKEIDVNFMFKNMFNNLYVANAWSYRYAYVGEPSTDAGYYPQAGQHFLLGVNLKF